MEWIPLIGRGAITAAVRLNSRLR